MAVLVLFCNAKLLLVGDTLRILYCKFSKYYLFLTKLSKLMIARVHVNNCCARAVNWLIVLIEKRIRFLLVRINSYHEQRKAYL